MQLTRIALLLACGLLTARTAAAQVRWRRVTTFDRSAAVSLPTGWKMTSGLKGMVSAKGPDGAVNLGLWYPVVTPELQARSLARAALVAPYSDPVRATRDLFAMFDQISGRKGGPRFRFDKVLSRTPVPWPGGGKGAWLHYQWTELLPQGKTRSWQTVALVGMKAGLGGNWTYYNSTVSAPTQVFGDRLPLMLEIWASWQISDRHVRKTLADAVRKLKTCTKMIQGAEAFRRAVGEEAFRKWSEYIRQ